jgi:virginiamycin A acetyltransferase
VAVTGNPFTSIALHKLRLKHPAVANRGEYTYGGFNTVLYDDTKLVIGKFCSIAANVKVLLGGEHDTNIITTYPFHILMGVEGYEHLRQSKGDIVIGNDVWIGHSAFILSGVTIGDGAVIGAGTVVSKDVEPYEIVGGSPQRHIRYRFSEEDRGRLLRLCWWDLPDEELVGVIPFLLSDDVDGLEKAIHGGD